MGHDDIGPCNNDDVQKKDVINASPLTDRWNIKQVSAMYFSFLVMTYFQMA